ncbi:MAG TPA: PBP1A family penicillin-binding protein [Terriglobia bacterium]|nr:PBP1A family penicillin-binding protein [Terriglobia bacterium]
MPIIPKPEARRRSPTQGPIPSLFRSLLGWQRALLAVAFLLLLTADAVFLHYYVRFSRMIDARLSGEVFDNASLVLSAPTAVSVGDPWSPELVAAHLRKAQYAEGTGGSSVGTYQLKGTWLGIYPGPASYFRSKLAEEGPAALEFRDGRVASITALDSHSSLASYRLEPEVITTLFDQSRRKRRLVQYQDLPKVLVDAVLATEDHRFFSHHGFDIYRIFGAALADIRADHGLQGGSTLTMQLARDFFLTRHRTLRVKLEQTFLALLLEQKLTKEQIFELYANDVYLGQRGSFSVNGFGEAADAYFNKDVKGLTLPEAALLAGLIRGPNLYSPYKYPKRCLERRNLVLRRMAETGFVTEAEAEKSAATPLDVSQRNVEASQAPFFVDMVKDQLLAQFQEHDLVSQSYRVYTTLDLDLQAAASEAVRTGTEEVDQQLRSRQKKGAPPLDPHQPQVALVALDPHTGAIRALVGGRDYGFSQLNHTLARRQPGSSFKPFVYAAALNSGVDGSQPLITTATVLPDEPTTFEYDARTYEPRNYKGEYHGQVTLREALALSLNNATVHLAEMIGYKKVKTLAVAAGINHDLLPTPALALGSYVSTPMEISGAYTLFANRGRVVSPHFVRAVNDTSGRTLWQTSLSGRQVLDPRVAYLMVNLMESVINNGTAAGVRSRGFTAPAAGKTGTSHDGWFAGFTSNLLAVVWVGYDDDRQLNLSGASSALPVWAAFMKQATEVPSYRKVAPFEPPAGIVTAPIGAPAAVAEVNNKIVRTEEVFIAGTEPNPVGTGSRLASLLRALLPGGGPAAPAPTAAPAATAHPPATRVAPPAVPEDREMSDQAGSSTATEGKKKGGPLSKIISIFKRGDSKKQPPPQQQEGDVERPK